MKKKIQAVEIMISLKIEIIQSERQIKVPNLLRYSEADEFSVSAGSVLC